MLPDIVFPISLKCSIWGLIKSNSSAYYLSASEVDISEIHCELFDRLLKVL
jgi:hypothetical protein